MNVDKLVTYTTSDEDKFLESLKALSYDEISLLITPNNGAWIGYAREKGYITIQRFNCLEELLSFYLDWGAVIERGRGYEALCSKITTLAEIINES